MSFLTLDPGTQRALNSRMAAAAMERGGDSFSDSSASRVVQESSDEAKEIILDLAKKIIVDVAVTAITSSICCPCKPK